MRICLSVSLTAIWLSATVLAENVVLVAGGGDVAENVAATKAKLGMPFGVEFDSAGNLYFVEIDGHRACRIDVEVRLRAIETLRLRAEQGAGLHVPIK